MTTITPTDSGTTSTTALGPAARAPARSPGPRPSLRGVHGRTAPLLRGGRGGAAGETFRAQLDAVLGRSSGRAQATLVPTPSTSTAPEPAAACSPRGPDPGEPEDPTTDEGEADGLLDPTARQAAWLGAPLGVHAPAGPTPPAAADALHPHARVSMEELVPQLLRRIAWGGDRRRGTVQLELGAGRHCGTVITVHAEAGRLRIELDGSGDVEELRARIDARLKRHGLDVESVR